MKTLLLLRHAKSSWKDSALPDQDRPLNARGKRAAPLVGELIRQQNLVPDQIVSSTAVRARTTAAIVAENCGYKGKVTLNEDLYDASVEDIIRVASKVGDDVDRLMLVGHNPGFDQLFLALTHVDEHLPTAGLAQIELPIERWRELIPSTDGELIQLWRPRELED